MIYYVQLFQERMVEMNKSAQAKIVAFASVDIDDHEARIERFSTGGDGQAAIRLSAWKNGKTLAQPLALSEEQLIELLHKAAHDGVISHGFVGKLREKIEI
jgi:hypothetical protein